VEPRLVREDLDEDPIAHPRIADVRFNVGDFHNGIFRRLTGRVKRGAAQLLFSSTCYADPG
jgi:hypothetical protein